MSTIDQLRDEIRAIQEEMAPWVAQWYELLNEQAEGMSEAKQHRVDTKIKFLGDFILEKQKQITVKETQISVKGKVILEKEKQITAVKQHQRGEATASQISSCLLSLIQLSTASCFTSFLNTVDNRMSFNQLCSHLFGVSSQHSQAGTSAGAGQTRATPTYALDCISSSNTPPTKLSSASSSSCSDCGVEMKASEIQPRDPAEVKEKVLHSSLRRRVQDKDRGGAGGTG